MTQKKLIHAKVSFNFEVLFDHPADKLTDDKIDTAVIQILFGRDSHTNTRAQIIDKNLKNQYEVKEYDPRRLVYNDGKWGAWRKTTDVQITAIVNRFIDELDNVQGFVDYVVLFNNFIGNYKALGKRDGYDDADDRLVHETILTWLEWVIAVEDKRWIQTLFFEETSQKCENWLPDELPEPIEYEEEFD